VGVPPANRHDFAQVDGQRSLRFANTKGAGAPVMPVPDGPVTDDTVRGRGCFMTIVPAGIGDRTAQRWVAISGGVRDLWPVPRLTAVDCEIGSVSVRPAPYG